MNIKNLVAIILITCLSYKLYSSDQQEYNVTGVGYYNQLFGHVYQQPVRHSPSLTNIACGHPMRILELKKDGQRQKVFNQGWYLVTAGPYQGYVFKDFISQDRPDCFQDKYPRFFEAFDLSITEMHFWGRLYNQFLIEEVEIP